MQQTLNPVPYRFCTLYSGSEGNAAYLETPSARILIDAGRCTRTLTASLRQLGVSPDELDAVFITHEHRDHVAALEVLTRKHPVPVHMLLECAMRYRDSQEEALCNCLVLYRQPDFTATVGDVTVRAFPTMHDSRASVGYRFEFGGVSVGYMTDTGCVTDRMEQMLTGCEAVVLESNHDENLLLSGPYPYELKLRIRSRQGHLSNRDAAELAARLAEHGTRHFLLAHLSETNNYPAIAYDETASALAGTGATVAVADPREITMLVGAVGEPVARAGVRMPAAAGGAERSAASAMGGCSAVMPPVVRFVTVGSLKEPYLREAVAEYRKRLSGLCRVEEVELKEARLPDRPSEAEIRAALAREGADIRAAIPSRSYPVALCVEGERLSSPALTARLQDACRSAGSLCFIIGSSFGLDPSVKAAARLRLSVSDLTFPHQLMRVILYEAVYRCFQIDLGTKYHK